LSWHFAVWVARGLPVARAAADDTEIAKLKAEIDEL